MSSLGHLTASSDAPEGRVAANVWIRTARRTRTFAALAYLNAAGWVAIALDVLSKPHYRENTANLIAMQVFLLGVAAISVLVGRRLARCGLWLSRDEILVVGPLRSWRLGVGEAVGFEPGVQGGGNGTPCPVLERTNGRPIGVWALGRDGLIASNRRFLGELRPLCEELNELLRSLSSAPSA
jgi:hypothetical protein